MADTLNVLMENLIAYNENKSQNKTRKIPNRRITEGVNRRQRHSIKENDETMLNLSVELPGDYDIDPDDVSVDVGVTNLDVPNDVDNEDDENQDIDNTSYEDDDIDLELNDAEESIQSRKCHGNNCKDTSLDECDLPRINIRENRTKRNRRVNENKERRTAAKTTFLNEKSLNRLFSKFIRENYKNISKCEFVRATANNNSLKLEGYITNASGKREKVVLENKGFNSKKLENKTFLMDFVDKSNTFKVIKENRKTPFVTKASIKNGILTFESLKYNYVTPYKENQKARVSGKVLNESVRLTHSAPRARRRSR